MKKILATLSMTLAFLFVISSFVFTEKSAKAATIVDIPDEGVKKALNQKLHVTDETADITDEQLQTITNLYVNSTMGNITSLNWLKYCTALTYLNISNVNFTLECLPETDTLTSLTIYDMDLSDTSYLEKKLSTYTNLNSLSITRTNITHLPKLTNNTKLTTLLVQNNRELADISSLKELVAYQNLREIDFENDSLIADITPLKGFASLKTVDFEKISPRPETADEYFDTLASFTNLNYLSLAYVKLAEYMDKVKNCFANLTNISSITLNCTSVNDLKFLLPSKNTLNVLGLNSTSIGNDDLDDLKQFTKLTTLGFGSTKITDLSFVQAMPNLSGLSIRHAEGDSDFHRNLYLEILPTPDASDVIQFINPVIGYDGNRVEPTPSDEFTYDSSTGIITLAPNTPENFNIVFTYNTNYPGKTKIVYTDITIHVIPTKKYNIWYNLDGGSISQEPTEYKPVHTAFSIPNPTKPKHDFLGWTGSNGDIPQKDLVIEASDSGDKSFFANWELSVFSINYDLDNGVIANAPYEYEKTHDDINIPNPTKDHYDFSGWTGSNGNTPQKDIVIPASETGNKNYYANWKKQKHTIGYILYGGTLNNPPEEYSYFDDPISIPNPKKDAYDFVGWTSKTLLEPTKNLTIDPTEELNHILFANWKPTKYTLSIDYNGGTQANNPSDFTIETPDFNLVPPTKNESSFLGWVEIVNGKEASSLQTTVTIKKGTAKDLKFKAIYKDNEYSITYDMSGAKEPGNPKSYTYSSEPIKLKNPSRKGYIFKGWTDGTNDMPSMNVVIPTGSTGNKTYTAIFEPKLYKIPFLKSTKIITKGSKFKFKIYGVKKGYKAVWNNSNKKVIKLSKKGVAKAKKKGNTTIAYRLYNMHNILVYGFQIKVKVTTSKSKTLNTSKSFKCKEPTLLFDKTLKVKKKFKLRFSNKEKEAIVNFKSSNPKILSVSKSGTAKAKKKGKAYVTITLKQGSITYHYRIHFTCEKK